MKNIFFLFLLQVSALVCFADEYKDSVSNVVYTYTPAENRAEVKRGVYILWDDEDEEYEDVYPGSPDAKDEIVILDRLTVNGKEYIVDRIGYCSFIRKSNIVSVSIPSSVKSIGDLAFRDCSKLSTVVIGEGLKSIGFLAFCNCKSLATISLPEGLEAIESGAFNSTGLTAITIPSTVQKIGEGAFNFSAIKTITSLIEDPYKIGSICKEPNKVTLRVPAGTKSKYEATPGWNQFLTIEELGPTGITSPSTIRKNGTYYDLQGRRLPQAPQKGVYIQNEKKVAIK